MSDATTVTARRALIERYFALVGAGEIDAVVACFAEDSSFWPPLAPQPLRHEVTTRVVVDGDRGLSELVFDATFPDGRTVHFENCNSFTFRGALFGDVRVYADAADMRRQLGV